MRHPKKRVTLQDVARLAGVSTAAVSYVINDGPQATSAEVRTRVLQAIQELDYHPHAFARALRAGRANTVGVIDNDYHAMTVFSSPYTAGILAGMAARLKSDEYYLLVRPTVIGEDLHDIESLLGSRRLDGVVIRLVQAPPATDALLEVVRAADVPCICIEVAGAPRFGFSAVTYDDRRGAYIATSYLLAQGHRRIGHIAGDERYVTAQARRQGYQHALADHGLPIDEGLVAGGAWDRAVAHESLMQFLALPDPPTAFFAANDSIAAATIKELHIHHYRVPEDVAVVGFDDIDLATMIEPELTTIRVPLHEIGKRAAEQMLEVVQPEDGVTTRSEILPVELIRRGSA